MPAHEDLVTTLATLKGNLRLAEFILNRDIPFRMQCALSALSGVKLRGDLV